MIRLELAAALIEVARAQRLIGIPPAGADEVERLGLVTCTRYTLDERGFELCHGLVGGIGVIEALELTDRGRECVDDFLRAIGGEQ